MSIKLPLRSDAEFTPTMSWIRPKPPVTPVPPTWQLTPPQTECVTAKVDDMWICRHRGSVTAFPLEVNVSPHCGKSKAIEPLDETGALVDPVPCSAPTTPAVALTGHAAASVQGQAMITIPAAAKRQPANKAGRLHARI
ncbi:MAG TPA: hypothetical protein VK305_00050 [Roseateles sp.]|nr:hypothetical protein [Roseateles sp.]